MLTYFGVTVTYLVRKRVVQIVVDLCELCAVAQRQVCVDMLKEVVNGNVVRHRAVPEVVQHVECLNLQ